jgi:AraC-like DNA-binding protein
MDGAPTGSLIAPLAAALVHEAGERGVGRPAMLAALGVDDDALADGERRIPIGRMLTAWELAMRSIRDDALPIAVAKLASVERFGLLGYVIYTRADVREALRALVRYHDLINDSGRWQVVDDPAAGVARVRWLREGDRTLGMRVANEQVLASFVGLLADAPEGGVVPAWISLRHARPRRTHTHDAHFFERLRWDTEHDEIALATGDLDRPPGAPDPVVSSYFAAAAEAALARVGSAGSWTSQVARSISDALASGIPTLESIAKVLGVGARTMRRRLASEGTTFDDLVVAVQRERAAELLAGATPLRDIAFALGFSDASAFSRAYRRWTGRSPSEDRARRSS